MLGYPLPPPFQSKTMSETLERITLGGGCFWCTEAVYERVRGVKRVESGYCNGHVDKPTYEAVCSGNTGHAEVVRLDFDPAEVSLRGPSSVSTTAVPFLPTISTGTISSLNLPL